MLSAKVTKFRFKHINRSINKGAGKRDTAILWRKTYCKNCRFPETRAFYNYKSQTGRSVINTWVLNNNNKKPKYMKQKILAETANSTQKIII